MIDTAMLTRLMVLTGFAPPEIPTQQATKEMMALARAIWMEAQNDEREACADACEGQTEGFAATSTWDEAALSCARAIRMRSNVKCG